MVHKHSSTTNLGPKKGLLCRNIQLFSKPDAVLKTISLRGSLSLIDTEQNTILKQGNTVLNSWSTEDWTLLGVDSTEKIAFFEASDSWLLAKLDLETGSFQPDDDPLFTQYDLHSDTAGTFVYDEISCEKFYLK